jgi:hypothetical protein
MANLAAGVVLRNGGLVEDDPCRVETRNSMLAKKNLGRLSVLLVSLTVPSTVGCGDDAGAGGSSGSNGNDSTSSGTTTRGTGGSGGSSATGIGGETGSGGFGGSDGAGGSSSEPITEVSPSTAGCFTLATAEATPDNPCDGDIYFLTGINVDLEALQSGGFCPQPGTYTTLASVPSDYSACFFEPYVEGIDGLANTGYIVADADALHHYRMQIITNEPPTIRFRFDSID